jgi:hypothetical protein
MVGLGVACVWVAKYGPEPATATNGESLAVALGAVSNIIATIVAMITVSVTSVVISCISFIRRERPWPAAIAMCLALSSLVIVVIAVMGL